MKQLQWILDLLQCQLRNRPEIVNLSRMAVLAVKLSGARLPLSCHSGASSFTWFKMTRHVSIFQPARRARGEHASSLQGHNLQVAHMTYIPQRELCYKALLTLNYLWRSLGNAVFLLGSHVLSKNAAICYMGFPGGCVVKNPPANSGDTGLIHWVRKIPWRRQWQPTLAFLPGKCHGQRSLAGYSAWGCKRVGNNSATKQQSIIYKKEKSVIMPHFPKYF